MAGRVAVFVGGAVMGDEPTGRPSQHRKPLPDETVRLPPAEFPKPSGWTDLNVDGKPWPGPDAEIVRVDVQSVTPRRPEGGVDGAFDFLQRFCNVVGEGVGIIPVALPPRPIGDGGTASLTPDLLPPDEDDAAIDMAAERRQQERYRPHWADPNRDLGG